MFKVQRELVLVCGLIINSGLDLWKRQISVVSVIVLAVAGLLTINTEWSVHSLIPGLLFLIIGRITHEAVGYGDGLIIILMGMYMDLWRLLFCLFISAMIAGVFAFILLVIKKDRKKEIPFVPFLLLGYLCMEVGV